MLCLEWESVHLAGYVMDCKHIVHAFQSGFDCQDIWWLQDLLAGGTRTLLAGRIIGG